MNKLFTSQNLSWKIASVVLAFVLWMFVINTQNPTQPQEISGIRIVITGLEQLESLGYELSNKDDILNQNFKVVVNGPRLEIDRLARNPKLITATLNLEDYMDELNQDSISDTISYIVSVNSDGNVVSVKDKNPQVTKVVIEKKDSKEQKVTYEIDESITKKYTLIGDGKPVISPEKIKITGAKTDLDKVSEAKVIITTQDFSEDKLVNALPITLFDADGNEITGLNISPDTVEVKLPIGSEKTVPIKVNLEGEMAEGYELVNTIVSPDEVTIVGKIEALEKIKEINLKPIDLSAVTKTDLIKTEMILPKGVITLGDANVTVSLEVVEKNTLSYPIQMSELNLTVEDIGDDLSYEILTPSINVILSAVPNKLISYLTSDIKATLNLKGYKPGEYTLPLVIIPPEGARAINSPININVRISEINRETQPSPDESDNVAAEDSTEASPDTEHQTAQSD